jgi:hypothetical protein
MKVFFAVLLVLVLIPVKSAAGKGNGGPSPAAQAQSKSGGTGSGGGANRYPDPRKAPPMDPSRKVNEQDCSKPVDLSAGNLKCK